MFRKTNKMCPVIYLSAGRQRGIVPSVAFFFNRSTKRIESVVSNGVHIIRNYKLVTRFQCTLNPINTVISLHSNGLFIKI